MARYKDYSYDQSTLLPVRYSSKTGVRLRRPRFHGQLVKEQLAALDTA